MLFHARFCNPQPDECFLSAIADEVPSDRDAGLMDAPADVGDVVKILGFSKPADGQQPDYTVFPRHF